MDFAGKVTIVTGAARGIGKAVAAKYAASGANVVLVDMDAETLAETGRELREVGGSCITQVGDVANPGDITAFVETTVRTFGRLDILINNAGIGLWKSPFDVDVAEWDRVIHVNLRGTFLASREAAKVMRTMGGGAIVNIASTRALMSEPNSEAYAATKGGIVALTHALALSLGEYRIRVNAISPGWIETGDYSQLRKVDHEQHPARRVGTPDDIARACLFLTHPDNDFITGENLVVDGGMTKKMIYEP
jgi:NAD(P)-dependent dehydrogenase (short-subunit alcohol dehydrogenase family)